VCLDGRLVIVDARHHGKACILKAEAEAPGPAEQIDHKGSRGSGNPSPYRFEIGWIRHLKPTREDDDGAPLRLDRGRGTWAH
jgi:hypothetical protein